MGADDVIWLLFIIIWFVSGIITQIRKMMGHEPGQQEDPFGGGEPFPLPPQQGSPQQRPGQKPAQRPAPSLKQEQRPLPPPPLAPSQAPANDPVAQMLRQLGMEVVVEKPVPSEHQRTASEHRRTLGEHSQSRGETARTRGEHRSTRSETRRTASEHRQDRSEVMVTASEHQRGDVQTSVTVTPVVVPETKPRKKVSNVVRSVRKELLSGPVTLQKALVLKEVLDKPVGFREPSRSRG